MPANPTRIELLNWKSLVAEAIRRRRAEKLTQRDHAALAGVSIPTIVAFDRAEETLTLAVAHGRSVEWEPGVSSDRGGGGTAREGPGQAKGQLPTEG